MHTIPHMNGKTCKPYLELVNIRNFSQIYTSKDSDYLFTYKDRSKAKLSKNGSKQKLEPMETVLIKKLSADGHLDDIDPKVHVEEKVKDPIMKKKDRNSNELPAIKLETYEKISNLFEEEKSESRHSQSDPVYLQISTAESNTVKIPQEKDQLLMGDILLRIKHKGAFSNNLICRVCFNTAYIFDTNMTYTIKDVDPVSVRKDDRISPQFAITIVTDPFCRK